MKMPPTKAELEEKVAELESQLESGGGEIPEHGHSKHETALQRQKRLRKQHEKGESTSANTQKKRQNRLRAAHAKAALDALNAD